MSPAQINDPDQQRWQAFRSHVEDLSLSSLGGTEREILVALKFFGQLTVPAISATIELSLGPLRQHMRHLQGLGLVESKTEPAPGLGRPPAAYTLSDAGESLFPDSTSPIGRRALRHMAERTPEALDDFLRETIREVAARHLSEYPGGHSPEGGILRASAADYLESVATSVGYLPLVEEHDGEIAVTFNHCPFLQLVNVFPGLCNIERDAFSVPFPRCTVERTEHRGAGDRACIYVVRYPDSAAS